jgi:hypothetical protein
LYGLSHEDLIDARWAAGGGPKRFDDYGIQVDANGIVYLPSALGVELYLWAHGLSETPVAEFLVNEFTPMTLDGLIIPDGAKRFIVDRPVRNGLTVTAGKANDA